jgi:hypothetical protein
MTRGEWHHRAACRGDDDYISDEIFHPSSSKPGVYRDAIRRCSVCPVTRPCLDTAMDIEHGTGQYRWGMWGGLTPDARARLDRDEQDAARAGTPAPDRGQRIAIALTLAGRVPVP